MLSQLTSLRCEKLQAPSYVNLALSIFILLGILGSYLPQHYRIIKRGTSEGISPYFILLGTTSGTCAFATILMLPTSRADMTCCRTVSTFECLAGLLGIAQVGVQWGCFGMVLLLYLIFFPRSSSPTLPVTVSPSPNHSWRTAVSIALICVLHGLLVIITSTWLVYAHPQSLGTWANILGVSATTLTAVQYFPQIWMTYQLGEVGSLSIPMMLIQTPGSFVWAGSLAARLGKTGWNTWGIYLVTGCLQGCLLFMGIWFEVQKRKASEEDTMSPTRPSLGGSGRTRSYGRGAIDGSADYMPDPRDIETDDEGNAMVGSPGERSPLLGKARRKVGSDKANGNGIQ